MLANQKNFFLRVNRDAYIICYWANSLQSVVDYFNCSFHQGF